MAHFSILCCQITSQGCCLPHHSLNIGSEFLLYTLSFSPLLDAICNCGYSYYLYASNSQFCFLLTFLLIFRFTRFSYISTTAIQSLHPVFCFLPFFFSLITTTVEFTSSFLIQLTACFLTSSSVLNPYNSQCNPN